MRAIRTKCAAPLLLGLWLLACTPGPEVPAEPVWGKHACGHCGMLVTEKPPSAQATLARGERKYFDDLGCMAAWLDREGVTPVGMWVRKGEGWVPAAEARFQAGVATPMDFGFLAADTGVGWEAVRVAVREKAQRVGGGP